MQYSSALLIITLAVTNIFAHGVVTSITGANGVTMPGLSGKYIHPKVLSFQPHTSPTLTPMIVIDGTPRDCASPKCGAEEDTSIIRSSELGTSKASALGRTEGGGPVDAAAAISTFMGSANTTAVKKPRAGVATPAKRGLLSGLLGGGSSSTSSTAATTSNLATGVKTASGSAEEGVSAAAGKGATSGLPTAADDGTVTMTFHQVNQDGAGALTAMIDPTSAGTDVSAFQSAAVTQDVPGIGVGGLSGTTTTDFPIKIQMPAGMTCTGSAGGASNVCVAKVQNSAAAGPFGGSVAFTQSAAAQKRAVEYNLRKMRFARGLGL